MNRLNGLNRINRLNGPPKGGGISWASYWATLISATVENAAPTDVVLTFPSEGTSVATDITATVNGVARNVSSASWTGVVWTVVLASAVIYGDVVVVTFVPSGGTANVTNNVSAEAELTTYITGLATPLSDGQKLRLNTLIKSLKTGLSITNLSDAFDVMYVLAGETSESSLRNLVKNAYYATAVNAPTFTQYEGFTTNGTSQYLNTNFKPSEGVNYVQNSASLGIYHRSGNYSCMGVTKDGNPRAVIQSGGSYCACNGDWWAATGGSQLAGVHILVRDAATTLKFYQNKTQYTVNNNSSGVYNQNLFIQAVNRIDVAHNYVAGQTSFAFIGKSFSQAQCNLITDVIEEYMDNNGKGVIP